jgi:hypothetical protein
MPRPPRRQRADKKNKKLSRAEQLMKEYEGLS